MEAAREGIMTDTVEGHGCLHHEVRCKQQTYGSLTLWMCDSDRENAISITCLNYANFRIKTNSSVRSCCEASTGGSYGDLVRLFNTRKRSNFEALYIFRINNLLTASITELDLTGLVSSWSYERLGNTFLKLSQCIHLSTWSTWREQSNSNW